MLPSLGGPSGSPLFSQHDSGNLNGVSAKNSDFSTEKIKLETLLTDHANLIKDRMFLNSRDTVSSEELELLLVEINGIRHTYPLLRENIRLMHRVRRQINKVTQYDESSFPPFLTIIENENKEAKSAHPMNVAKMLHEKNISGIKEVNFKGKNKIGVNFDNPFAANSFIEKNSLNGYRAYIPEQMLICRGIVKRIGDNITEEDFIKYGYGIRGSKIIKIIDATRFNFKRVEEGVTKIVPGSTYMLMFAGNLMPQEVKLFYTKREVTPYIKPVILCYNCLKYGHHKQQCKVSTKCFHCGGTHLQESCQTKNQIKKVCPNCSGDHPVNSRSCIEYNRQQKINQAIADHNITFFEANKLFPKENNLVENRVDIRTDFPNILQAELPTGQKSKPHVSYAERAAKKQKVKRSEDLSPNFDINIHNQQLMPNLFRTSSPNGSMLAGGAASPSQLSNNNIDDENEENQMDVTPTQLTFDSEKLLIENIVGSQVSTDSEIYKKSQKFLDSLNSDLNLK